MTLSFNKNLRMFFFIVAWIALPFLIKSTFFQHLLVMILINTIVVLSLDMLVGHVGLISLGHAGFMGIGAYVSALLTMNYQAPFLIALLTAFFFSAVVGLIVGYPSLRMRGHYFVIVTFICGIIFNLLFTNLITITRGPMGIPGIPYPDISFSKHFRLNFETKRAYYYLTLFFMLALLYIKRRISCSKMGRALLAIREDEELAKSVGINIHAYKVIIFVLSTAFTGMAGGLYAHYIRFIGPDSFTLLHSFNFFVMNLVGGKGTVLGPIIGPFLLTVIDELSQLFQPAIARIIFGVFLILTILYMPQGIMGLLTTIGKKK